jgi:hypothetical protein
MKRSVKKKPKISIWARVKNVLDNSPWTSAFTYPIAYMISTAVIGGVLASSGLESIGWFFLFIFYLTPLWVLFGLIVSKRRLPYLLSFIIGLVIPVWLAVVAYNGFTGAAKVSATKTIHAQNVRYISRELEKCSLGDANAMKGLLNCSKYNAETVMVAILKTSLDKNPFNTTYNAVRSSSSNTKDEDVGYVSLSSSGSNIIIKSCNKTPCKKEENRKQSTVSIN